jgi:hypothetical protein
VFVRRAGECEMGTVIDFPEIGSTARSGRPVAGRPESATVIILPVIRIERYSDEPSGGSQPEASSTSRRRRRRRVSRS